MHTGDGHIVHQCLSGNTEAFALLVDKYKGRIFALVYAKVGQFQDAEDLTQDIFLEAYKNLSTLRRWDNFYPWLYSIASNQCKNYHRAQKRQVVTAHLAEQDENHRMDMDAHSEKLKNERVHDALAALPEMHRQVLVLRYMAGMKSKEIAETLRVSPNAINQRLMRARAKLKAVFNEEMIQMMRTTIAERKLHPGFTTSVIELISNAKIQTAPHKTALPLGLSAAGGLILLLLSLSLPYSPLYPLGEWLGGSLPLNTQVVEDGKIPVDAEATRVAILGAEEEDSDFGRRPEPLKTPAAIGHAEETNDWKITVTGKHVPDDLDITWDIDISPDGTQMVYVGGVLRFSSNNLTQLRIQPLVDTTANVSLERTVILEEDTAVYNQPNWSPDGQWIAFYRHVYTAFVPGVGETLGPYGKDIDVYLVSASGGKPRFLAHTNSTNHPGWLSWSPDSKELAFVKWKGKKSDISIVTIDTGVVRPFTTDGEENTAPSWWPDGKWISYASRRGVWFSDRTYPWKQRVNGGNAEKINGRVGFDPLVHSPDGKWVTYTSRLPDGRSGFLASRVNADGELTGEPILLKSARLQVGAKPLRWTPDWKITVLQEDYSEKTYALNAKTGEQRRVNSEPEFSFGGAMPAQWAGDGKRLFLPFGSDQKPGFLDLKTSEFVELPLEVPSVSHIRNTTFSPDKTAVAFTHFDPKNVDPIKIKGKTMSLPRDGIHVYTMPVTGGQIQQLTDGKLYAAGLRWSPDGRQIAFISGEIGTSGNPASQLYVVSASDGNVKKLTDSGLYTEVAWSPDGKMLAYLHLREKGKRFNPDEMEGDLYVVRAAGGGAKQITDTPEQEINISWTPDGKRLTFNLLTQGAVNQKEVWVASIDGGEAKMLQRGYIPSSWSSDGTSYLAFGRNGELQRISLDGKTIDELPIRVPANARPISMSPDGETILYRQITSGTQCWSIDVSHLVSQ